MVRPEVISKRMHKLDEYLSILKQIQRYSYRFRTISLGFVFRNHAQKT